MSFRLRLLAILSVLGMVLTSMSGVFAAFTESVATQTQDITTGSGSLTLTDGSLRTTLASSISDLVPSDWVPRTVTIHNGTSYDFAAVSLTVADSAPGAPFTSDPEGLRMTVESCSSDYSSCTTIYGPDAAPTGAVLANISGGVLSHGGDTNLRITQRFVGPNTSKSLKGAAANLTYTFNGIQRPGNGGSPINSYESKILGDNPVSFFKLDEPNGATSFTDTQGLINDATYYAFDGGNPYTSAPGLVSTSTSSMAATDQGFQITSNDKAIVSPNLTFEALVSTPSDMIYQELAGSSARNKPDDSAVNQLGGDWSIVTKHDGSVEVSIRNDTQTFTGDLPAGSIPAGETFHLAATFTPTAFTLYVNGASVGSVTLPFAIGSADPTYDSTLFSSGFQMDDVAFYTTALSPTQIAAHATDSGL